MSMDLGTVFTSSNELPEQGQDRTRDNRGRLWPALLTGVDHTLDLGSCGWLALVLGAAAVWQQPLDSEQACPGGSRHY